MDNLRALAEAATPGPWLEADHLQGFTGVAAADGQRVGATRLTADAAYLAAIDPTTLLALLDERDALLAIKAAAVALVAHDSVDNFNALCDAVGVGDEPAEPGQ